MKTIISSIQVRYLLLFPFLKSFSRQQHITLQSPKDAPYFYELDINVESLRKVHQTIEGTEIEIIPQIFDDQVFVFECAYTISNPEDDEGLRLNNTIQTTLKELLRKKFLPSKNKMMEEYTILLASSGDTKPDQFIDNHADMFASFIRNAYEKNLDEQKIKDILAPRVRYSEQDLVVLDWNGGVVIANDGDFQSDIDMLKIGNYQLIRYRMLDEVLEQKLNYLEEVVLKTKFGLSLRGNSLLQDIIKQRLSVLLTIEKLDTSLMLIGDWYSSHLYRVIFEEFYIDRWKTIVETKMENLKSLHETISDNLSLSWRRIIDQVTFVGWFVMMVGYFVLFYIDLRKH